MQEFSFNLDFFGNVGEERQMPIQPLSSKKRRKSSSRNSDLILNKQDILDCLEFVHLPEQFPTPIVHKVVPFELPSIALPFYKE